MAVATVVGMVAEDAAINQPKDYFGLGWRPELTAEILANSQQIDVVEIIAEQFYSRKHGVYEELKLLSNVVYIAIHGVSLGLASSHSVDRSRAAKLADFVKKIKPLIWSEHLAFVRAGGYEIGHLAAPPWLPETIQGAIRNIKQITKLVGSKPLLENIATLVKPPFSAISEQRWTSEILNQSGCNQLLDLHNLYANAVNFGEDPFDYLEQFPINKVRAVHLSGGIYVNEPNSQIKSRLVDDHKHDIPEELYEMLTVVGSIVRHPVIVIIERDGNYPDFPILLDQLNKARDAVAKGRKKAKVNL